jgi:hypothetical protein
MDVYLQGSGLQLDQTAAAAIDRMSPSQLPYRPAAELSGGKKIAKSDQANTNSRMSHRKYMLNGASSAACNKKNYKCRYASGSQTLFRM